MATREELAARIAELRREYRALSPGPGRKRKDDRGRLLRAATLLLQGKAPNPWQAALLVAQDDTGADSVQTTRRRIYDKYRVQRDELEREAARLLEIRGTRSLDVLSRVIEEADRQMRENLARIANPAEQLRASLNRQIEAVAESLRLIAGNPTRISRKVRKPP